jgi:hypothetical protein
LVRAFLSVDAFEDDIITKENSAKTLLKDVVFQLRIKKEEVMFMNRSVNYFAKRSVRGNKLF